jgi:hypothetical protein
VSNPSDESELLDSLKQAAEFMREIRKGQAQRGKGMTGGVFLGAERLAAIEAAGAVSNIAQKVDEVPGMDGTAIRTVQIFEEMCRRQHVDVGESMRSLVVRLLATELLANREALPEAATDRLETLTAVQGAIGPELVKEFGERFKDSRSYLAEAVRHATNPRAYLQEMARAHTGKYEKKSACWTAEAKNSRGNRVEDPSSPPQK